MFSLKISGAQTIPEYVKHLGGVIKTKELAKLTSGTLKKIGSHGVAHFKAALRPHRYTGALERSVIYKTKGPLSIEVGPTAKRGRWDAASLLEYGTRPHIAPYPVIQAWSDRRGAPPGAVWASIIQKGTAPHPFFTRVQKLIEKDVALYSRQLAQRLAKLILGGRH